MRRELPPLVETAIRGRSLRLALRVAIGAGVLGLIAIGAVWFIEAPAAARAEAFVGAFVDSTVKGTELHSHAIASPARPEDVDRAKAWMTTGGRVVECSAVRFGFSMRPPRLHECRVRFDSGAVAIFDVAEQDGEQRVVTFASSPPRAGAR